MESLLEGIGYLDDIRVNGKMQEEHLSTLEEVLIYLEKAGLDPSTAVKVCLLGRRREIFGSQDQCRRTAPSCGKGRSCTSSTGTHKFVCIGAAYTAAAFNSVTLK